MVNYQDGKVYMVWYEGKEERYYGSTANRLSTRLSQHKTHYKNKTSNCSLFTLFDKYGTELANIELVEAFPCNNRNELEAREGFYIRNNTHINRAIPGRTKKESDKAYREANKDTIKEKDKAYYQTNKEKLKERQKTYYEAHREEVLKKMKAKTTCQVCGSVYNERQRARHLKTDKHTACL